MSTNQRGLYVRLGAGDDTATGSGFGDNFDMGLAPTTWTVGPMRARRPGAPRPADTLDVFVADSTAASAVSGDGTERIVHGSRPGTAFNSGYTAKVSAGAETDYIKNIENVNVQIWNDANSNGQKDWGSGEVTFGKNISLALNVNEIKLGDPNFQTRYKVEQRWPARCTMPGPMEGQGADTFSLTDISSATQTLMSTNQRGLYVNLGAGDDTATGSGFGDNFDMGCWHQLRGRWGQCGHDALGRQGQRTRWTCSWRTRRRPTR
jgi:hypothetical protein